MTGNAAQRCTLVLLRLRPCKHATVALLAK
jgi:hypothetical protein